MALSAPMSNFFLAFLFIIDCGFYAITKALFYIGLYPSAEAPRTPSWSDVFPPTSTDQDSFEVPMSSLIKKQLPVLNFSSFAKRYRYASAAFKDSVICSVCLEGLEDKDKVRKLGNCWHAFHKTCIDRWVDIGQDSCPVCRAPLNPPRPVINTKRKTDHSFLFFMKERIWCSS